MATRICFFELGGFREIAGETIGRERPFAMRLEGLHTARSHLVRDARAGVRASRIRGDLGGMRTAKGEHRETTFAIDERRDVGYVRRPFDDRARSRDELAMPGFGVENGASRGRDRASGRTFVRARGVQSGIESVAKALHVARLSRRTLRATRATG